MATVRARLEGRLTYLWTFELLNVFLFLVYAAFAWAWYGFGPASAIGLGLSILLLLQGSLYWYAKLRSVRERPLISDATFVRLYSMFRWGNPVLLAVGLAAGVALHVPYDPANFKDAAAGVGLWLLAVLEHVNYFIRQLMYDAPSEIAWLLKNRRLKMAVLSRDIDAGKLSW